MGNPGYSNDSMPELRSQVSGSEPLTRHRIGRNLQAGILSERCTRDADRHALFQCTSCGRWFTLRVTVVAEVLPINDEVSH